jgi:L-2-hydroxyglutarate oxidase LhgO
MTEKINIAIIGGGIIGCCVALELAKNHNDIYVFEKNPGITRGENQSSRNSGVLHAGI